MKFNKYTTYIKALNAAKAHISANTKQLDYKFIQTAIDTASFVGERYETTKMIEHRIANTQTFKLNVRNIHAEETKRLVQAVRISWVEKMLNEFSAIQQSSK